MRYINCERMKLPEDHFCIKVSDMNSIIPPAFMKHQCDLRILWLLPRDTKFEKFFQDEAEVINPR